MSFEEFYNSKLKQISSYIENEKKIMDELVNDAHIQKEFQNEVDKCVNRTNDVLCGKSYYLNQFVKDSSYSKNKYYSLGYNNKFEVCKRISERLKSITNNKFYASCVCYEGAKDIYIKFNELSKS